MEIQKLKNKKLKFSLSVYALK